MSGPVKKKVSFATSRDDRSEYDAISLAGESIAESLDAPTTLSSVEKVDVTYLSSSEEDEIKATEGQEKKPKKKIGFDLSGSPQVESPRTQGESTRWKQEEEIREQQKKKLYNIVIWTSFILFILVMAVMTFYGTISETWLYKGQIQYDKNPLFQRFNPKGFPLSYAVSSIGLWIACVRENKYDAVSCGLIDFKCNANICWEIQYNSKSDGVVCHLENLRPISENCSTFQAMRILYVIGILGMMNIIIMAYMAMKHKDRKLENIVPWIGGFDVLVFFIVPLIHAFGVRYSIKTIFKLGPVFIIEWFIFVLILIFTVSWTVRNWIIENYFRIVSMLPEDSWVQPRTKSPTGELSTEDRYKAAEDPEGLLKARKNRQKSTRWKLQTNSEDGDSVVSDTMSSFFARLSSFGSGVSQSMRNMPEMGRSATSKKSKVNFVEEDEWGFYGK